MIEGRARVIHGTWYLEYFINDRPIGTAIAPNREAAGNLVCYRTRKYVYDTLEAWLKQRRHAWENAGDKKMVQLIDRLQMVIFTHKLTSYRVAITAIAKNAEAFMSVAPHRGSGHYGYYHDTILPILQFCMPKEVKAHD